MNRNTRMMLLASQNKNSHRGEERGRYDSDAYDHHRYDDRSHRYGDDPMQADRDRRMRQHRMSDYDRYEHSDGEGWESQRRMKRGGYDHYEDPYGEDWNSPRRRKRRAGDDDRYEDSDDDEDWEPSRRKKRRGKSEDGEDESYPEHIGESQAREWTMKMHNSDGTHGPHFAPDAAEQLRTAHCPDCDRWDFFAAVNMTYSDYASTLKKLGMDKPEAYACLAKAFLCDEDAKQGKLARYMKCIPE